MEDYPDELMQMLQLDKKVRYRRELCHIRAIVDDEYVVYKVWWTHHQRWEYKIEWFYRFWLDYRDGRLQKA